MNAIFNGIGNLDARLFFLIVQPASNLSILRTSLFFSWTANGPLFPLLALGLFLAGSALAMKFLVAAAVAFAIELPIYWLVKNLVKRDRPYESLEGVRKRINPPDRFSFPSGHTTAATLVAVILSMLFPELTPLVLPWAAMVGFSRVHLAVHYPSDVLAGAGLGTLSALIGLAVAA